MEDWDRSSEMELDDETATASANGGEDMSGVDRSSSGVTRSSSVESSYDDGATPMSEDAAATSEDAEEDDIHSDDHDDDDDEKEEESPMGVPPVDGSVYDADGGGSTMTTNTRSPLRIRLHIPPKGDHPSNVDYGTPLDIERDPKSSSSSPPSPPPPPPRKRSGGPTYPNLQRGPGQGSHPRHMPRNTAAVAQRNRQIHVPPIGSPGLLMLPTSTNMPEGGLRHQDLVYVPNDQGDNEEYILPSTVFRESMVAGGYSIDVRSGSYSYQGSSTDRTVGDMFDCDAGPRMYLHFPPLLPEGLWNRRLGDVAERRRACQARQEAGDGHLIGEGGGAIHGSSPLLYDALDSSSLKAGPKGARSSYIFFTNAQRPLMALQFPGMKFTEQGVIMGERWRALTPEEKKPYEDMANADKERHTRETMEYIQEIRREMRDSGQENALTSSIVMSEGLKDGSGEDSRTVETEEYDVPTTKKDDGRIRGPRLVDEVILSLSKMLGEKLSRNVTTSMPSAELRPSSTEVKTEGAKSEEGPSEVDSIPSTVRQVTPDLTLDELPFFLLPSDTPQTRPHPRPHVPMSFLDMLPVSLTATYPVSYVAKRREYALAVQAREDAIVAAQEAKDDAEDAEEKYLGHVEAWDRMLEYQKAQSMKRELDFKRERELFHAADGEEVRDGTIDKNKKGDAVGSSDGDEAGKDKATNADGSATGNEEVEESKERPTTPPPEDPMDCMPPRPQRPCPACVIPIPKIPTPPSPPPVVMRGSENDRQVEKKDTFCDSGVVPMIVPKVDQKLLQHLDQSCFLPTMLGRYLGLLSNHIADPQFCGPLAPGIAGNTIGGGTGLATSYPGGGRGSGPFRGGGSSWHSMSLGVKCSSKEKLGALDEATSFDASPADVTSSDPSFAPSKLKRLPGDGGATSPSDKKSKKQKKGPAFILTTGDRNTTALEVASGSAGSDFPDGWIMKTYRRSGGETVGKTDKFWFSPGRNIRFRARKHAMSFIGVLLEPGVDGDEDKAAAIYKTRGLHF